jgi:hypothetical protein
MSFFGKVIDFSGAFKDILMNSACFAGMQKVKLFVTFVHSLYRYALCSLLNHENQ